MPVVNCALRGTVRHLSVVDKSLVLDQLRDQNTDLTQEDLPAVELGHVERVDGGLGLRGRLELHQAVVHMATNTSGRECWARLVPTRVATRISSM